MFTSLDGLSGGDPRADAGSPTSKDAALVEEAGADFGEDAAIHAEVGADAAAIQDAQVIDDSASPPLDAAPVADDASEDAGEDAGQDAGEDAASVDPFGSSCPVGTVYSDPLATNPLVSGMWSVITGPVSYNATEHLLKLATGNPNTQVWIGARPAWTDYTISVQVRIDTSNGNGGINFRMANPGTANDSGQMYYAGISPTSAQLGIENNGYTNFSQPQVNFNTGTFYTLAVIASGSSLSVAVNGTTYINYTDTSFSTGSFGLRTFSSGMSYRAVSVVCNP